MEVVWRAFGEGDQRREMVGLVFAAGDLICILCCLSFCCLYIKRSLKIKIIVGCNECISQAHELIHSPL